WKCSDVASRKSSLLQKVHQLGPQGPDHHTDSLLTRPSSVAVVVLVMDGLYINVLSAYERSSPVLAASGLTIVLYHGLRWLGSAFTIFRAFVAPRFVGPKVNFKQMGEWAAITGATDGIGKCYAEQLAEKGMNIILLSRNPDKLKRVATEI
ncbi:hypothetical protein CAPTEDRAFT_211805, partial [Capitella teleta]